MRYPYRGRVPVSSVGQDPLGYAGCGTCRPEAKLQGRVRKGPAAKYLARSALAFMALAGAEHAISCSPLQSDPSSVPGACAGRVVPWRRNQSQDVYHPVFHIVEEPGGIRHLTDCEVPTEEYNAARSADLAAKYPNLSPGLLEHLEALEPFLDTSIVAGF